MPPGTKYVRTLQRNWLMIKKKQLSGHILFDDSVKSPQAIRRDHGVTSSFFGIGILPASDLTGRSVFRSVLLVWRELLFFRKRGAGSIKKGAIAPLFPQKGGQCPLFEGKRVPAKITIPKCTDGPRFPLVLVW